jgi:anaerobic ribonucleoside-triphosphate reductase activating protein
VKARIHAFEPHSRANGPGVRAVLWFQGCTLGCPGCFNPDTHASRGGREIDTEELAGDILTLAGRIEGVTISGGEPFEQPAPLLDLLRLLGGSGLGVIVFTGFTWRELQAMPVAPAILARADAVIAGRYVRSKHAGRGLLGSSNQEIRLVTSRYGLDDFRRVPPREVIVRADGSATATGVSAWHPGELVPSYERNRVNGSTS